MVETKKNAVIDMGTNSIRLLTCEIVNKEIKNRKKEIITTRLGENVNETKMLTDRAINESLEAVIKFYNKSIETGHNIFKIIGTSALRDAKNSNILIENIKKATGLNIDIISGKKEAEYGFSGVINAFDYKKVLVIDIGGGSTELILGDNHIDIMESLDIGAVRMTGKCVSSDPINKDDLKILIKNIDDVLNKFFKENIITGFDNVIGIGGTITTLGAIKLEMDEYNQELIQGYKMTASDINLIIDRFIRLDNKNRIKMKGLHPKRADIILAGSMILKRIMRILDIKEILLSDYDNLEGIIFEELI